MYNGCSFYNSLIVISIWITSVRVHASVAQWSALMYVSACTARIVWLMVRQAVRKAGVIQTEVTKSCNMNSYCTKVKNALHTSMQSWLLASRYISSYIPCILWITINCVFNIIFWLYRPYNQGPILTVGTYYYYQIWRRATSKLKVGKPIEVAMATFVKTRKWISSPSDTFWNWGQVWLSLQNNSKQNEKKICFKGMNRNDWISDFAPRL